MHLCKKINDRLNRSRSVGPTKYVDEAQGGVGIRRWVRNSGRMSYGWYFIHWIVSELPEDCIGEKNASGFCPIVDDDREGEGVMKTGA